MVRSTRSRTPLSSMSASYPDDDFLMSSANMAGPVSNICCNTRAMSFHRSILLCFFALLACEMHAAVLYNVIAQLPELVKCIFLTGQKFKSYDFTPSEFSFGSTGIVYRARFRPQHALPHMVWVTYPKDGRVRWKRAEQVMNDFSVRLVVKHGQTRLEVPPHTGIPIVYRDFLPEGVSFYVGYTLFIFHVGEFDWHYDDEIELTLEVQSPVSQESYLRLVKPKLTVSELPYLG